jgi:integrase
MFWLSWNSFEFSRISWEKPIKRENFSRPFSMQGHILIMTKITQKSLPDLFRTKGRHNVGGGLAFKVVDPGRQAYWVYKYRVDGRQSEMSLGPYPKLSLAEAKAKHALEQGKVKGERIDPLAPARARRAIAATAAKTAATMPTFGAATRMFIDAKSPGWGSPRHVAQWEISLLGPGNTRPRTKAHQPDHCLVLRHTPIDKIDVDLVLKVLQPIWHTRPETASRIRGRIENVIDYARVRFGFDCDKQNPAAWRGNLKVLLTQPKKLTKGHHPAVPYAEIPHFMARLRQRGDKDGGARPLELIVLTALRESEALKAIWGEIDFSAKLWVVPAKRMKMKKEHRVPLSDRALEILRALREATKGDYMFPGLLPKRPMSRGALVGLLERMGVKATVHGFRSSFRDWAGEVAHVDEVVAEHCLAHSVGSSVRRAYARGDMLERRRELMDAWGNYCGGHGGAEVVPINRRRDAAS